MQNQLMKKDSMQELNTQTDGIIQILKSKKIVDCSNKEIIEKLSIIYMMVGLRPHHFPTQAEDMLMLTFIKKHFGLHGIDEMIYAFELAILGKLDVDDVKIYDQFTIEYLVKIMNSYKRWIIIKSKEFEKKPEAPKVKEMTDQEKMDEINDWKIRKSTNYKLIPIYLFDWMKQFGILNQSEKEKIDLYHRAIKLRESELRNEAEIYMGDKTPYRNFTKMKENNFQNITDEETLKIDNIYKKISVFEIINNDKKD